MKKMITLLAVAGLVLAVSCTPASAANLLLNGSFELGPGNHNDPNDWLEIANSYGQSSGGGSHPGSFDGSFQLHLGNSGNPGGRYQDITTVIGQDYTFTFWATGWLNSSEDGVVQIGTPGPNLDNDAALDGDNNIAELLDLGFTGPAYNTSGWLEFTNTVQATKTTTRITFLNDGGLVNVDLVSFEAIPEPATMSLLAIGGLGVLLKRRRRRA